jgi:putative transposase
LFYTSNDAETRDVLHGLARQKESEILEVHLCWTTFTLYLGIPPKYAVSQVVGYIKRKSAIQIARTFVG